jgi:hypothetical protein
MGVFNTIIGYESFESYLNPNYGRSYGWQIEPTQHTGLLASYQLSEAFRRERRHRQHLALGRRRPQRAPRASSPTCSHWT